MSSVLPPTTTPFGERVACRLRDELIIWLTTVGANGTPHPNPVWFLWDGDSLLVYSLTSAVRNRNIQRDPHVALNFDGNGQGGDIIVITGEARIGPNEPPADQNAEYIAKYAERIARSFGTPANFAAKYGTAIRVTPMRVHGH
jgi:PPOX class probable F420-dependent enzyme